MLRAFLRDESGQAATEYILLLALVTAGVGVMFKNIIRALDKGVVYIGGALEKDLRTGRMNIELWAD